MQLTQAWGWLQGAGGGWAEICGGQDWGQGGPEEGSHGWYVSGVKPQGNPAVLLCQSNCTQASCHFAS